MTAPVGERFARALAGKDAAALKALLAPEVDFRGLTPNRFWESSDAAEVVDSVLLGAWFEPEDVITDVLAVESGDVAGRERVSYRFRVRTPGGDHVVEQQAYLDAEDGRIRRLRVMCSGFVPEDG